MKLLNWAKEKVKAVSDYIGRRQFGDIQRFNQVAPIVAAPDREQRKEARKRYRLSRWQGMNVSHGCPVLTGMRLERTAKQCSPFRLTVLPRYMRQ